MGRKKLTERKKREILLLYEDLQNYSQVAERAGVAVNTVKNVWLARVNNAEHANMVQEYADHKKKDQKALFEKLQSTQVSSIVQKALNMLQDDKNMENELQKYGYQRFISMIGMMTDKNLAIADQEIKKRKLEIEERELEIKQKQLEIKLAELEMRKANPDAFREVHIYNDAPSDKYDASTN